MLVDRQPGRLDGQVHLVIRQGCAAVYGAEPCFAPKGGLLRALNTRKLCRVQACARLSSLSLRRTGSEVTRPAWLSTLPSRPRPGRT